MGDMGKMESNVREALRFGICSLAVVCCLSFIVVAAGLSENSDLESINMTSGGVAWVTTMDVDELERQDEKARLVDELAEADQAFGSMESILHWAIGMPTKSYLFLPLPYGALFDFLTPENPIFFISSFERVDD